MTVRPDAADPAAGGDAFEVEVSRGRAVLLAALSLALAAGGVLVLVSSGGAVSSLLLGAVAVAFFGTAAVSLGRQVLDPRPVLRIDETGIRARSVERWVGVLTWSEVAGVGVLRQGRQRYLGIMLSEPAPFLASLPPVRRAFVRLSAGMTGWTINLPASTMDVPADSVVEVVLRLSPAEGRGPVPPPPG